MDSLIYLSKEYFDEIVYRIENADGEVIITVRDPQEWLDAFKKEKPYIKSIALDQTIGNRYKYKVYAKH
jgi:hypothetical protein